MREEDYQEMILEKAKARRERIATAVLAGWGEPSWSASEQWQDRQNVVQAAITYADLLIEELDKR